MSLGSSAFLTLFRLTKPILEEEDPQRPFKKQNESLQLSSPGKDPFFDRLLQRSSLSSLIDMEKERVTLHCGLVLD